MSPLEVFVYHLLEALAIYTKDEEITVEAVTEWIMTHSGLSHRDDTQVVAAIRAVVFTLNEEVERLGHW